MTKFKGRINAEYQNSEPAWPDEPLPPPGAPNIVMVVLDDVGFAQLGCYGADIATPRINQLAERGLRLRNFNTTGICSATRSCLLTGRNHHSNHMGAVAELATGFPGYDFRMPKENGTIAEILVQHGYATFAVGKWHLTPAEEHTLGAARKRWPLGRGFERFYGFHGSDTSQYHPDLVYVLNGIAQSLIELQRHAEAARYTHQALALIDRAELPDDLRVETLIGHARALRPVDAAASRRAAADARARLGRVENAEARTRYREQIDAIASD